jgi:beta-phosphoglucomutase-like phosphatase (HAD superfamily)
MLNYNNFDAILFDMDGTIFDSETVHREAWKITASQFGQVFTDEMYLQFIGITTPDCMKLAIKMFNNEVSLQELSASYSNNLNRLVQRGVPLKAGFIEYLALIKTLDKPLGIVTSSPMSGVQSNFDHYDFYSDFTVVVSREHVSQFKPNPAPYLQACEQLSVEPHRTIVFEDSNAGATAALDAGCYTIGIPDLVEFEDEITHRLHRKVNSFKSLL